MNLPRINNLINLEIVELDESDCGKVLELINSVQPHIPWSEEHFHWQYFGRSGHQSMLYGAIYEKNLVGFYAAVKNNFQFEISIRDAYLIQDVMTAEEFRGQGILHLLGEVCSAEIDRSGGVGFTFPNEKSANSFRRLGWTEVMGVPLWEAKCGPVHGTTTERVSEVSVFEDSVNQIWDESGLSLGVLRDAEYLNWRYSKPGVQYLKYIVGDFAGYFVLKLFTGDHEPRLHLLDLVLKEEYVEVAREVLNFVFFTANELKVSSVTCWLPVGHKYESYFSKSGFSKTSSLNRSIFVRNKVNQIDLLPKDGEWHFSQGDSDVF